MPPFVEEYSFRGHREAPERSEGTVGNHSHREESRRRRDDVGILRK